MKQVNASVKTIIMKTAFYLKQQIACSNSFNDKKKINSKVDMLELFFLFFKKVILLNSENETPKHLQL